MKSITIKRAHTTGCHHIVSSSVTRVTFSMSWIGLILEIRVIFLVQYVLQVCACTPTVLHAIRIVWFFFMVNKSLLYHRNPWHIRCYQHWPLLTIHLIFNQSIDMQQHMKAYKIYLYKSLPYEMRNSWSIFQLNKC